jgi:voltage-gated potassium channel
VTAHDDGPTRRDAALDRERRTLLKRLERWLETPMLVLGFVWLGLLVLEFARGLAPALARLGTAIWVVFILDFALRFTLAPRKLAYLRRNWLTALSLLAPALRVFRLARLFRVLRLARAARGVTLVRVLGSANRAMRGLAKTLGRRGFGYVAATTAVVLLAGAAGMLAFEGGTTAEGGIDDFGTALWWTAMILTTMGSDYFPHTSEGRALCLALAVYGFTVFGYVTATLATFFVARDAEDAAGELAGAGAVDALRGEIVALRADVRALAAGLAARPPAAGAEPGH